MTDALAGAFDISPSDRNATVSRMLSNGRGRAAGYWLQLVLATGIATLGLVLDSTAVVIGAMLISPLMGPIVELGMGLAIGSPLLVIRSFFKTLVSVVVALTIATALTLLLPFHEVTGEIGARTSPTALDLGVAVFCALAAAYAVIRPSSDTAATAAGTAIGIALVPPLCVVGFGFGSRTPRIAGGAALLFTANFGAILVFSVVAFLALGYGQVRRTLEDGQLDTAGAKRVMDRLALRLQWLFASRYGTVLRLLMPLLLLLAIYVPLRRALAEVTWEISVRREIQSALATLPDPSLQSYVHIERHQVTVRLVTVGRQMDAADLETRLAARIQRVAGVKPAVQVLAVPDDAALRQIEATLTAPRQAPTAEAHADLSLLRAQATAELEKSWPSEAAGPLLRWDLDLAEEAHPTIEVVHLGPRLGAAGEDLLGSALSSALGSRVGVRDRALSDQPISAESDAGVLWLPALGEAVGRLQAGADLVACIEGPEVKRNEPRDVAEVAAAVHDSPVLRDPRVHIARGDQWIVRLSRLACPTRATDAGWDSAAPPDGAPPE